jgi:sugar phosphate permease
MATVTSQSVTKAVQSPRPAHEHAGAHKWLVAIAVMLGATLEVLDTSIVNVSLPHMQGSFSASVDEVTWILTSYIVANGVMIPLTGWISTRLGRKRYFISSVILFVIASGACGAAQSLDQIVIFRVIQGGAGAAMIPSSQAILMETFPPEEQGLAMAVWGNGDADLADDRPHARWLDHGQLELALELLYQPADWNGRRDSGLSVRPRS